MGLFKRHKRTPFKSIFINGIVPQCLGGDSDTNRAAIKEGSRTNPGEFLREACERQRSAVLEGAIKNRCEILRETRERQRAAS